MAFSGVNLGSICLKGKGLARSSNNYSIFGKWMAGSWFSSAVISCSAPGVQNSSPWLMLPPVFEGDHGGSSNSRSMSFKFYSLAGNKVVTLGGQKITGLISNPNSRFRFSGSLHGWLVLIDPDNRDLFLYNPLSGRHLKLPPIHNLPNYPNCTTLANKVILSSSPDDDDGESCRAMMIYNCMNWLAFCCPGRSKEWTLMGNMRWWYEGRSKPSGDLRRYEDCVYSARDNLFFCLTKSGELEAWDLRDPSSPAVTKMMTVDTNKISTHFDKYKYLNVKEHLVVAEQDLLMVTQYAMDFVAPDGSYVNTIGEDDWITYPYMTKDFNVQKYDPEEGDLRYVDGSSLGGLAIFLGLHSHSVALPAASHEFPELMPNSIYFTDVVSPEPMWDYDHPFGGHDIGIFNYEDKTVSPCYYPCDVRSLKRIVPPPMWFFPSGPDILRSLFLVIAVRGSDRLELRQRYDAISRRDKIHADHIVGDSKSRVGQKYSRSCTTGYINAKAPLPSTALSCIYGTNFQESLNHISTGSLSIINAYVVLPGATRFDFDGISFYLLVFNSLFVLAAWV